MPKNYDPKRNFAQLWHNERNPEKKNLPRQENYVTLANRYAAVSAPLKTA